MMRNDAKQISREEKVDATEFVEMSKKLTEQDRVRVYYMMQGMALIDEACRMQETREGA